MFTEGGQRYNKLLSKIVLEKVDKEISKKMKNVNLIDLGFKEKENLIYEKEDRQWRTNGILKFELDKENKTVAISFNNRLPIFITLEELKAITNVLDK